MNAQRHHYGWLVAATGTLCIFASLGFGRFALGMVLPSMSTSLGLSYSQMGLLSTANFIGYLVAVLVSGIPVRMLGSRTVISGALLMTAVCMALVSVSSSFSVIVLLFFLVGIGSGASNVPMMALVPVWFPEHRRGRAAGIVASGSGLAIIVAGRLIPYLNAWSRWDGWRISWRVIAVMVAAVAGVCMLVLRNRPADVGLIPEALQRSGLGEPPAEVAPVKPEVPVRPLHRSGKMYHLGAIYFLFGFTYVVYSTFFVTVLVEERGFTESAAGTLWSSIGFLSLLSGPVFGTLSDRLGRRTGLMIVFAVQTVAYVLLATSLPGAFLWVSVAMYGVVAWSIPTIMAALVGDSVGPDRAAQAFGFVTFIFGLGQIAGPSVAGMLAQASGSFSSSFALTSALAGGAIILSWVLPPSSARASSAKASGIKNRDRAV